MLNHIHTYLGKATLAAIRTTILQIFSSVPRLLNSFSFKSKIAGEKMDHLVDYMQYFSERNENFQ